MGIIKPQNIICTLLQIGVHGKVIEVKISINFQLKSSESLVLFVCFLQWMTRVIYKFYNPSKKSVSLLEEIQLHILETNLLIIYPLVSLSGVEGKVFPRKQPHHTVLVTHQFSGKTLLRWVKKWIKHSCTKSQLREGLGLVLI